jgi:hypothetical protein
MRPKGMIRMKGSPISKEGRTIKEKRDLLLAALR